MCFLFENYTIWNFEAQNTLEDCFSFDSYLHLVVIFETESMKRKSKQTVFKFVPGNRKRSNIM